MIRGIAHLDHPALLYSGIEDFLDYMVPFVEGGLAGDDVVFVAARADNLEALRTAVGGPGRRATWVDTNAWHPHPSTRLGAFHRLVTEAMAAGARAFTLVGEPVWPPEPPELVREWQRYESVLNRVLGPFPVSLACLYDASALEPSVVATARRTHRSLHEGTADRASASFEEPEEFLARWNAELPPPPPGAVRIPATDGLALVRRTVREEALRAGVPRSVSMDLAFAVNEAVTNAVVYASGVATVWAWAGDGRFTCQFEDDGPGVGDPLAGYRPPSQEAASGRGLWLARQLVDLLQIVPGPTGTTVRLSVCLP